MVEIANIMVNYQEAPIGVEQIFQLGWKIVSEETAVWQKAYQFQLAEDAAFEEIIYDSGVVESEESAHVTPVPDRELLQPVHKYWIRVRIQTTSGSESLWKQSCFVTAYTAGMTWDAAFITLETEENKDESKGHYLRKTVQVKKKVKAAYACTTALGLYHFYINGQKVGEDEFTPGWTSYNKHLLYQMYDVTAFLQEGENTLGAMLGAGWYKGVMGFTHARNNYGTRTAFLARLFVTYEDGSTESFVSDESWQGEWSPILFSEIYDGETYDARKEIRAWNTGDCTYTDWKPVHKIAFDVSVLSAQSGAKVRQMTKVPAQKLFVTPQGDTVIDFGQNLTGWVEFHVKGAPGEQVVLHCFEVLDASGNVYLDNLRKAKQTVTYLCGDDREAVFHPNFSFQGFQYVRVKEYPGEVNLADFTAYAVHSEMAETGSFVCSNPDLNQLHHNIQWGMKGNFLDVPTDCPQRDERLGWTGDAQIFCRTASYLMDTYTFFTKWLTDVAADQTPDGGIPHVIPDLIVGRSAGDWLTSQGEHSAAAWADVAVIMPWTLYLMYGDTAVIETQYDSMKAWIEFMRRHATDYIWNYKLQFGDWVALDAEEGSYFGATPNDLTCTAFYAYSTCLFAKMAKVIGNEADAQEYEQLYQKIVNAYQKAFLLADGHLSVQTQTAQILSLYFNLIPEDCKDAVTADLLKLLEQEKGHLVTGFVGTPYFCHALSQNGHTKEAYELLLKDDFPSWLYQVKEGATTVWEHWDGKKTDGTMWSADMNSFNHYAYGAIGEWIYRVAAGIECDEAKPGFKHTIIMPHAGGGLSYMNTSYNSIYGTIVSNWKREGAHIALHVEIPCNTTWEVRLKDVRELKEAGGLSFERSGTGMTARGGSGSYDIVYEECL
ncbi:MAG: family 78 glycoside hydrolase catalytic domain [Lachnospiraceae bacterium]